MPHRSPRAQAWWRAFLRRRIGSGPCHIPDRPATVAIRASDITPSQRTTPMQTEIHEIAPSIHKLSTFIADAPPSGFGFNQYLIEAEQPLLFHCGGRGL